tara:strand:- start:5737 stop:6468 length:732 start_codon:yes stop_codon:yes gene_type:complete
MIKTLSVILPLYNEEKRLNSLFKKINKFKFLKKDKIEFIFVDDGSNDNSNLSIKKFINENKKKINIKLVSYKKNKGKGFALKKGIASAKHDWIITTDIDLSVKLEQIKIWEKKELISKKFKVYFGSRLLINSKIIAKKNRKFIGFIFNILLRKILVSDLMKIKDTQCGFKLYKKDIAKKIFKKLTENGYIHDVEILILLQKSKILVKELPVEWEHKHGSKINLFTDSFVMLKNLFSLKKKYNL